MCLKTSSACVRVRLLNAWDGGSSLVRRVILSEMCRHRVRIRVSVKFRNLHSSISDNDPSDKWPVTLEMFQVVLARVSCFMPILTRSHSLHPHPHAISANSVPIPTLFQQNARMTSLETVSCRPIPAFFTGGPISPLPFPFSVPSPFDVLLFFPLPLLL